MAEPLKVALAGCGMVSGPHLSGWAATDRANVIAVCDINAAAARAKAVEFGIPEVFEDFRVMLDAVKPDIVDICTTLPSHRALALAAAEAGCHVFLEKPMSDSLEAAREMVEACRKADVSFMVCQNFRWYTWTQKIKALIDSGAVGMPCYLSIVERNAIALPTDASGTISILQGQPHYRAPQRLVGFEMAIHHIDLARWWTGEPEYVFARMLSNSPHVGGDDMSTILMGRSNFTGVIEESWASPGRGFFRVAVEGDEGSIVWDGREMTRYRVEDPANPRIEDPGAGNSWPETFGLAQSHFLDCLATQHAPMTSGEDNLKSLSIALAGYEADSKKQTIGNWKPAPSTV